ncbi:MAG: flagellar hook-basal body complex protein FliE [Alphaproteobacteria bacterium]|nr:flagellar hook-basal body complex protein FliE [Alphaproteobacteria bacterium]MCZ6494573.1 flagellar hook-basal body complex protein FliE [Alphaproteobacteria bacterium]MCZ6608562.1 flagellar hook-basal body complex protein FliE [Alphaproteobacteria bacterium]MCZ6849677.1 flagellar hook-basal body complex protein FliE [Alphaproteobacteria bacterium]
MPVNLTSAVGAYNNALQNAVRPGLDARTVPAGKSFEAMVSDVAESMLKTGAEAEKATALAITGKADLNQVVMAVASADIAVQTVVAVRDKVIQAYQEILRMPI